MKNCEMTGDEVPSYSFSTPYLNQFHAFSISSDPSTSDKIANTPLTTGRMKRKLSRNDEQFGSFAASQPKKALYEDRMSNKLWNFHIGDNNVGAIADEVNSQPRAVEELNDDWGFENVEIIADPIVEEPPCNLSDDYYSSTADGIVLSSGLKEFLKSCRERDGDFFFKPSKSGKELVLYQPPHNLISSDIHDRIQEVQDWDEEELDEEKERTKQIVSFPESKNSSPKKNGRKKSTSPTSGMVQNKTSALHLTAPARPRINQLISVNCVDGVIKERVRTKENFQDEDEMEID